ncbi:hypothetical protein BTH42_24300 [Burkholderia sp. SRS-W-2-2016]|uniref:YciI family protein n=1 Tax=Burkholderia sp. SRS-W-2-2016 TaxID=1926878 RepID=UPI00094AE43D|nr:YciI family protein [Burkholderia sp. SRS-W-2-2016]OLL29060.1 hypothetical protein BTH42_24300 [Burkholderia sp. SRS-W-2-2016]
MLFAVLFEDNDNCGVDVRDLHMQAHLDFLGKHASMIKAAGPLRDNQGSGAGGLWLVEADTPEAVDRLVRTDPFWPTGLRRSVRVLIWKQVFAAGARI